MSEAANLPTFDLDQTLAGGWRMPARMTVLPLGGSSVALVSPIPIDDALAASIAALGQVRFLIAPNLMHHLYLGAAIDRYPQATVLAPRGLRAKRSDLRIDHDLEDGLPEELGGAVDAVHLAGAEGVVDEFVFFHRSTRTLVVTDLVFNVRKPRGFVAHVVLFLVGCHGRLGHSRLFRLVVKDRAAAAASIERILALPFETLVMAHGDIVDSDARPLLASALSAIRG